MDNAQNTNELKKQLNFDEKVIKKVAGIATSEIEGILTVSGGFIGSIADRFRSDDTVKGIEADIGEKQVAIDLKVVCEYGKNIPELFDKVIENVRKAIKETTGLEVIEVNMYVEDVLKHEDFDVLMQHHKNTSETAEVFNAMPNVPETEAPHVQ